MAGYYCLHDFQLLSFPMNTDSIGLVPTEMLLKVSLIGLLIRFQVGTPVVSIHLNPQESFHFNFFFLCAFWLVHGLKELSTRKIRLCELKLIGKKFQWIKCCWVGLKMWSRIGNLWLQSSTLLIGYYAEAKIKKVLHYCDLVESTS